MPEGPDGVVRSWIETFQAQTRIELQSLWTSADAVQTPGGAPLPALQDPWGALHRPDWHARGLLIWPRGQRWLRLHLRLPCPRPWRQHQKADRLARLLLRWWADAAELWVDGVLVHQGDLFDTACRWPLPASWWQGETLELELRLRSPLHDDGALITSRVELEPLDPADPNGVLLAPALALATSRLQPGERARLAGLLQGLDPAEPASAEALRPWLQEQTRLRPQGGFHVLSHAHLDLAWLWPVADTWLAAQRTFASVLDLLERNPQLHFAHSSPALYAWIEQHRPDLFARLRQAMQAGRFEPINGPWVESDCVLIGTASLLQQFEWGQAYSRSRFPEWQHNLCWLPDSFGFAAGLPAVAAATGVRWFCTHKLAWNAVNPFPHRLFRWRSRCGAELLALATAPIGTDGDPEAMERYRQAWQQGAGVDDALWLPGVGDHGGGPSQELLDQLELWQQQPIACPQRHGSLRRYLSDLEPLAGQWPVWRDELYLELHRGCATSRPDQKRHNRSLERLLREADLATALLALQADGDPEALLELRSQLPRPDWRPLLFQQFHDILPGTSIPEVFEQAEPQWRAARRLARQQRDQALGCWLPPIAPFAAEGDAQSWWLMALHGQAEGVRTLRLPPGCWQRGDLGGGDPAPLPRQPAPGGGDWVQVDLPAGVAPVPLHRQGFRSCRPERSGPAAAAVPVRNPVQVERLAASTHPDQPRWLLSNGLLQAEVGEEGLVQLWSAAGVPQLAAPLEWRRWKDHGEFWDAWDLAADYRDHPLPLHWQEGPVFAEEGPLCTRLVWRGVCGRSPLRLDLQLRAASPLLELTLQVQWQQRHELMRLEIPLAQPAVRIAADTSAGVIERPAEPRTAREQARWEVPVISWLASQAAEADAGGLAVLLDGPQGVSASADRLGVSLLRGPTWPDPSADQGLHRMRLALMPCSQGWCSQGVPRAAQQWREPLWLRPAAAGSLESGCAEPAGVPEPLSLGGAALQWIGLRPAEARGEAVLTVQNLSPQRQRIQWPSAWRCLGRLEEAGGADGAPLADPDVLAPWQLTRFRISRRDRRMDR